MSDGFWQAPVDFFSLILILVAGVELVVGTSFTDRLPSVTVTVMLCCWIVESSEA